MAETTTERQAYSPAAFYAAYGMSHRTLYTLWKKNDGPPRV